MQNENYQDILNNKNLITEDEKLSQKFSPVKLIIITSLLIFLRVLINR